ncbi:bifunctional (p)ppGpp synthetase/guanosine-3',5'-bis(diphosphate) 3'-pyrophosphohydrolase [Undibacterium sp. RTI2.1]|uniref:RelA/SpoT family protein n=1 Tax=unclassified Undibacterium TaxID=2630295 RepID=UPI002AB45CBF|nr:MULTISPECIES: bifunctional (p)ppGpp synthetase/guanosine-3',5'-bis(diphosphate) 3'-pyrophosphohydrolase [unclassified Undibacterium]MDY7538405.1 bifunctional (p)ppGpp synthetase/guanosine-3',5'-bis(diphosphate) 3'-pyrophosphohydrolase [Undibacterium sp. 5I1]MEB0030068.1 bifunctional (p)ppGpp synthetase/guanosine-3',5'-bis(diphosphate) 3'-pyrophosphohydrolase [Undibacterium sp. RTI2.1]MEB0114971.1 bifunctional (p)ppGpp synthetase/guanosine-3',5'-bis(diphosphate) 3'-pyrophosphohydrolase [Undiba
MVSTSALAAPSESQLQSQLLEGLSESESARVMAALEFVTPLYVNRNVVTGQNALQFVQGVVSTLVMLRTDVDTRIAGLLFELPELSPAAAAQIETRFGKEIGDLVSGIRRLMRLREAALTQHDVGRGKDSAEKTATQMETLRKMVLAMATDMRVVLVRLASRVTTLRYFADCKRDDAVSQQYASETMDLYAPLANRLGVWQLKWELEDLSFRFMEPAQYKRIAKMLEEKRLERESFVVSAISRLNAELKAADIKAEVSGRPKHIYSIFKKMKGKDVNFDELYDVRAFRVVVDDVKDCYTVLGLVHNAWTPLPNEFDDYISRPKQNGYQSLHTVVVVEDGRPLEVQIRTRAMHQFAEYGVAAHWRYKESGGSNFSAQEYDEKIAWLRQLLAWKSEVADVVVGQEELQREWVEKIKAATLDDRIYVLTPQARVIELPSGSTPVDFAYHLHTDVGHRCRGARVDNVMVPLNTPLKNGQTVEIITLKVGSSQTGPSRDWLNIEYSASTRTRSKIRAWFNVIDQQETLSNGRALVEKTLQREGKTAVNLDELARKLGFANVEELFLSVGKDEFSLRQIENSLRETVEVVDPDEIDITNKSRASSVTQGAKSGVLVVGTEGLMTQLARCCKPAPPDGIIGFVTRGKGVSIHRLNCKNFAEMRTKAPERVLQTTWGEHGKETVYPVDIFVLAQDRQGLLRDISEVFSREKINVIGVNTQSAKSQARMSFTAEITGTAQLQKALMVIREVSGVLEVRRN